MAQPGKCLAERVPTHTPERSLTADYDGGDYTASLEQNVRQFMPTWMANGMMPSAGDMERLMQLLGRPLRTYGAFAAGLVSAS